MQNFIQQPLQVTETYTYSDGDIRCEVAITNNHLQKLSFQILPSNVTEGKITKRQLEKLHTAIGNLIQTQFNNLNKTSNGIQV